MTENISMPTGASLPDDAIDPVEGSAEQVEEWERESVFASRDHLGPDDFPCMWNMSAGFLMRAVIRPMEPTPPEYLAIDLSGPYFGDEDTEALKRAVAVSKWNMVWEAAQFRRRYFDEDELTADLVRVADRGDLNIIFVPRTPSRYYEYAPVYHLLDRATCERFSLPLLTRGQWPFGVEHADLAKYLPVDFESRLSQAWANKIWRRLNSGSPIGAFTADDPIRLLAHNLDYWVPSVTEVIQSTLGDFPVSVGEGDLPSAVPLIDGSVLEGAIAGWPRKGGDIWRGEEDASEIIELTVERADRSGHLRDIIDAVRANRVEEDFSDRWSYEREDFERKLYRKRNKISVKFVELTDTIPVPGPDTDVEGALVTADFMALLDERERQIVILLSSGYTKLSEIALELGYANHSPISKRLARIRQRAQEFFGE